MGYRRDTGGVERPIQLSVLEACLLRVQTDEQSDEAETADKE
jgi:hypothetical protein